MLLLPLLRRSIDRNRVVLWPFGPPAIRHLYTFSHTDQAVNGRFAAPLSKDRVRGHHQRRPDRLRHSVPHHRHIACAIASKCIRSSCRILACVFLCVCIGALFSDTAVGAIVRRSVMPLYGVYNFRTSVFVRAVCCAVFMCERSDDRSESPRRRSATEIICA